MKSLATALTAGLLLLVALVPAIAGATPTHDPGGSKDAGAQSRSRPKAAGRKHRTPHVSSAVRLRNPIFKHRGDGGSGATEEAPPSGASPVETPPAPKPAPKPVPAPVPTPVPIPAPTPEPAPEPPAAPGSLIFGSGFDGNFNGWYVQSLSSRATISTTHPFEGSGAARLEVRPGDVEPDTGSQRSEVTGPTFNVGEDIYVRDEIRVPYGYTFQGNWQLINQLHEKPWSGSPGIATFLDPNRRISFGAGDGSPMYWRGPQLESERWYDLVYRVNLSMDPSQGFVEVWFDGVPQVLNDGLTRMYGETIQTSQTYLKAGIYRSLTSSGISIIEHDNIAVGTSLAAVMNF